MGGGVNRLVFFISNGPPHTSGQRHAAFCDAWFDGIFLKLLYQFISVHLISFVSSASSLHPSR